MSDTATIGAATQARREARRKRRMALKRRQFERHAFRLPVTLAWDDVRLSTTTRTLGLGGLFVGCEAPPAVGTRVTLTLTLASPQARDEVALTGEVVYLEGDGMGIKFVDVDANARGSLRAFFLFQDLHCYNTENLGGPG